MAALKWLHHPFLLLVLLGSALRLVHLLSDNYFVSSADSYYFYHYADCIRSGTDPLFRIEPGISYLVGIPGKVIGLDAAAVIVPLIISAVIMAVLYAAGKALFNRSVGIGAALMWATVPQAYWITGSGYLDRDGLTVGILTAAGMATLVLVHRKGPWPLAVPVVCVAAAAALYYAWSWIGGVIAVVLVFGLLLASFNGISRFYFVTVENMLILILGAYLLWGDHLGDVASLASHSKYDIPIAESRSMGAIDALLYWHPILIMAVCLGVWAMARRIRGASSRAIIIWLVVAIVSALVVKRLSILALPAVCLAGGVGLTLAFEAVRAVHHKMRSRLLVGIGCFIGIVILGTFAWHAYIIGTLDRLNPSPHWQEALSYIREETPPESLILCSGDYGYWVLALAEREPLAYGGPVSNAEAVAAVYCAATLEDVMAQIRAASADFFIFSVEDLDGPVFQWLSRFCPADSPSDETGLYNMVRAENNDMVFFNGHVAIVSGENYNERQLIN